MQVDCWNYPSRAFTISISLDLLPFSRHQGFLTAALSQRHVILQNGICPLAHKSPPRIDEPLPFRTKTAKRTSIYRPLPRCVEGKSVMRPKSREPIRHTPAVAGRITSQRRGLERATVSNWRVGR
ncbi:hypothetical protein GQ600_12708 [Phytophthora cactorum]|nr:hypothetical protein GQ600_12708 [Phytophthora cactorum]